MLIYILEVIGLHEFCEAGMDYKLILSVYETCLNKVPRLETIEYKEYLDTIEYLEAEDLFVVHGILNYF